MTWSEATDDASTWLSDDGLFYVLRNYIAVDYFEDESNSWTDQSTDATTWVTV